MISEMKEKRACDDGDERDGACTDQVCSYPSEVHL
jgi:hypothetical protein